MKKISAFWVSFAAVIMFTGIMTFFPASAATVLPTDSPTPRSGCTFLGLEGEYITQIQESIDLINQIRLEACREGVENPATGDPLTENDYVPIQWSADLEYIARLRAAEASVTMDHARTNGESIWFKGPNGASSNGEVLAWNWGKTMTDGINQWYDEKSDWVNKTGAVTGHYTIMINPNNHYVGLATFYSDATKYPNTTAGEFGRKLNDPDTSRGSSTGHIIQTLEVKNENISYNISGTDSLYVSAAVSFRDYWSGSLKTEGLTLVGDSAKNTKWSSSNDNIVSVSDGKLTVKSCGSAAITATLPNGTSLTKPVSYQHSYETATTEATCKTEGKIVKKCKICGDTDTQVIPKTDQHSYETATTEATCKAEGKIVKKCKICGDTDTQVIPKTDQHSFGNWATTKAPTANSDGLETRTCEVCSVTETRALKFDPQNNNSNSENNSSSDNSSASSSSTETSASSSGDSSSDSSPSDDTSASSQSSSASSSSEDTSDSLPSDDTSGPGSSVISSSDETHSEGDRNSSNVVDSSDTSDTNSSNMQMPIVIIAGVLLTGVVVLVVCLVAKRKRK